MNALLRAVAFLTLCLGSACAQQAEAELNVDFRKSGNALLIVNKNPFDYHDLDAVVNERFHYRLARLKANETRRVPLDSFATAAGTRFSLATGKLSSMTLQAVTAAGSPLE